MRLFFEQVYPSPQVSTDSSATLSSSGYNELFNTMLSSHDSSYSEFFAATYSSTDGNPFWERPLRRPLVSSTTRWSSLPRSPTTRSASTRATTASCCGIVQWRASSSTRQCQARCLAFWRESCILLAMTTRVVEASPILWDSNVIQLLVPGG
jgi:hypothetical protein